MTRVGEPAIDANDGESANPPEPSGERFIPELMGDRLLAAEHHVRYRLAAAVAAGQRVLDAGCGVGWGSSLLLQSGASTVTGIDIDAETVADAARRYPDVAFAVGDLQDLPLETDSFDVVACFEALEHVADPERALDELARVLTDDGVLLVSSPNPGVYPPGNPFHVHEMPPEQLSAAVARRFAFSAAWHQHALLASILTSQDRSPDPEEGARLAILTDLGRSPVIYSAVIASNRPLPALETTAALVSARELDDLALTAEALVAERAALAAFREQLSADTVPGDRSPDMSDQLRRAVELQRRHAADAERARAERDDALLRLLEIEQRLAASPPHPALVTDG